MLLKEDTNFWLEFRGFNNYAPFLLVVASKVDRLYVAGCISCQCTEFTAWKSQLWGKLWFAQCHLSLMSCITGKPLYSLIVHHLLNTQLSQHED